ncbi:apolipoprotein M isoform X3 [Dendrobates tinctorius]|uniref:apolipoprotein M isoform X3 n=1 Tax=Dendrobates tinctorius TaxID=92724 RepID=UPI003CC9E1CE
MIVSAWRYFLYFYGLIFDSEPRCDRNDQLSASRINRTEFPLQYMGSWYFLAAAAESGTGALDIFKVMDNGRFLVRGSAEMEKLEFTASIRIKDGSCVPRKWIYLLTEESTELRTEARSTQLDEDCVSDFLHKSTCENYKEILQLPRSLEKCPQDE